jgi:vancomycin resistance protein YoaR
VPLPRPRRPETLVALIAGLVVLLGGAGLVAFRVATADDDRVPAGTTIAGIDVAGLTADEAVRAVRASAAPPAGAVEVALDGRPGFPQTLPVGELGPQPRARAAVNEAIAPSALWRRVLAEVGLERSRDVPLAFRATPARGRAEAEAVAAAVDQDAKDATVGVGGGRIVVGAAKVGRAVDPEELARRLGALPTRVEVPVVEVSPAVDTAAAEAARLQAARIARVPVTVRGAGRRARIDRATLLRALRFTPAAGTVGVTLDGPTLARAVTPDFAPVLQEPRSASFAVSGTAVSVVPSRTGRSVNPALLARRVAAANGSGRVRLPVTVREPQLTTAEARAMRIREQVSTFTTPYACCQPRVTNIKRAAAILDGTIIPAGARFSLNEGLGERTRARGFVPAPQINDGELEDAVGGGVSQMGTTVYNAAFFAGLEIVTHVPHEFWITRYPAGREATISWGGPELIFRNDWDAAILMKVTATDTSLTVSMYSSKLGRRVTTRTTGDTPVAGQAFKVFIHRKVFQGSRLRSDTTVSWSYKAPPAGH